MSFANITIEELRELINKGESSDPLIFLESIMSGYDPRTKSALYDLVNEINQLSGGHPSKEDWEELTFLVEKRYKYTPVSLSESSAAAKTIAEYLHSKRKQIEISDTTAANAANDPLTDDEIKQFLKVFEEEYGEQVDL